MKRCTAKNTWFEFAEKLIQTAYSIFGDAQVPITEKGAGDPKVLAKILLARTLSNFKGAIALTRDGMTVEARILTRCCFENFLWIGGLQAKGDEFARAMRHEEGTSTKVRGEFIFREAIKLDEKVEKRIKAQLRDINKKWPKTKSLNVKDMAQGRMFRQARQVYRQLSSDAGHPSITSLNRYYIRKVEEDGETVRGIDVAPPPKEDELSQTLDWACEAMLKVCVEVNDILEGATAGQKLWAILDEYQALTGAPSPIFPAHARGDTV